MRNEKLGKIEAFRALLNNEAKKAIDAEGGSEYTYPTCNTPHLSKWEKATKSMSYMNYVAYAVHLDDYLYYTRKKLQCAAIASSIAAGIGLTSAIIVRLLKK